MYHSPDEVAEWLRRWTANPMCSARVGSNPILVDRFFFSFSVFSCRIIFFILDSYILYFLVDYIVF